MNLVNFVAFKNELKRENMFKGTSVVFRETQPDFFASQQEKHWRHGVPRPNEQDDQVVWMGFSSLSGKYLPQKHRSFI